MTERCPVCGRPYRFAVPTRRAQHVGLARLYRHRTRGRTYLHEIRFDPDFAGAEVQV